MDYKLAIHQIKLLFGQFFAMVNYYWSTCVYDDHPYRIWLTNMVENEARKKGKNVKFHCMLDEAEENN